MKQTGEKMSLWNVIKMAGAWISFCIGSAFATGTGIMQVYGSHGMKAYAIIPIAMIMFIYFVVSFFKLGFKGTCKNSMDIFEYYCGKRVGTIFKIMTIVFMFLSPTCMISGFGATLSEYFGTPAYVGSLIMGAFCLATVLLGLKKLVNIVGVVGPVIIILTLWIGGSSVLNNWGGFQEGVKLSMEADILKYSNSWFVSGLLESAWAPLILGPFLVSCASTVKSEKEAITGGVLGVFGYGAAIATMVTAYFCQFAAVSQQMVPTLYLALQLSSKLTMVFVVMVFLGIYSSAVPSQFNFCATFFPEKTFKYNITAIVTIVFATLGSLVLPFDLLLNKVYVFFSYASWIFILFMMARQIRDFVAAKKEREASNT